MQFNRFVYEGKLYHSREYKKVVKRNSFSIEYVDKMENGFVTKGLKLACDNTIHYLLLIEKLELVHDNLRGAKQIKVIKVRNERPRECTIRP